MTAARGAWPTVAPATIEALQALDAATIYNVLKGLGRAEPGSYSGPELRCLFPELGTLVGYAVTSEWTGGEPDAPNEDYLELLELIESMPKPVVSVLVDVGSRPGRSGIAGDGMMREFQVLGAAGAVVAGSIIDIAGIERLSFPVSRAATPGIDPRFVGLPRELLVERAATERGEEVPRVAVGGLMAAPDLCAAGCCPNLRGEEPVVGGPQAPPKLVR